MKVRNLFITVASVVTVISMIFMLCFFQNTENLAYGLLFLVLPLFPLIVAFTKFSKIKTAMSLTRAYETAEYVKERQDRI